MLISTIKKDDKVDVTAVVLVRLLYRSLLDTLHVERNTHADIDVTSSKGLVTLQRCNEDNFDDLCHQYQVM